MANAHTSARALDGLDLLVVEKYTLAKSATIWSLIIPMSMAPVSFVACVLENRISATPVHIADINSRIRATLASGKVAKALVILPS